MDQGEPQAATYLTCEGTGCNCETSSYGTVCGASADPVGPIKCTTGISSIYRRVIGDKYLYCSLSIDGATLSEPRVYGAGPDMESDDVFGCRPANDVGLHLACRLESSPIKAYCSDDYPECAIMSIAHPQISCVGSGCIGEQVSDASVITVSSPKKGAVVSFSDSLFCTNPPEGEGDCVCSNEGEGMCQSSKDKGVVTMTGVGQCDPEILGAACTCTPTQCSDAVPACLCEGEGCNGGVGACGCNTDDCKVTVSLGGVETGLT
eukprot:GHVN01086808.1.p1 GENE.GHVN01086808.1~~GHVN01086808.1.p1  ORF type:complete len:263 (+),score=20.65 GHVN01086808.1:295-1083(+)